MLVASGPTGEPIVAEEVALDQLLDWSRNQQLHCPNCRNVVHVRGGRDKRMQLHFAHQRGVCPWSTEGETVRHMRGKLILAQWLRAQFPQATVSLEERLPGPNRIADVFMLHPDGKRQAVEFQCAPLDLDEWQMRHAAYRAAGIIDTWIIGSNRLEKREAFIEAIISFAREIVFLDPLLTPAHTWLRWPVTHETLHAWQGGTQQFTLSGWVGRLRQSPPTGREDQVPSPAHTNQATGDAPNRLGDFAPGSGATIIGELDLLRLTTRGTFSHPQRAALARSQQLLRTMEHASIPDPATFAAYLTPQLDEEAISIVMVPLMRAYLRDPDLLRRYNYGRGQWNQPISSSDQERVERARAWLRELGRQGFSLELLRTYLPLIPPTGPYAALASYLEMLLALA